MMFAYVKKQLFLITKTTVFTCKYNCILFNQSILIIETHKKKDSLFFYSYI